MKNNNILYIGVIITPIFLLLSFLQTYLGFSNSSYNNLIVQKNMLIVFLAGVFIMPVLEEFSFRGWLFKTKKWRYLAYLLSIVFCVTLSYNSFSPLFSIVLIFAIIGLAEFKNNLTIKALLSSVVFSLMHYATTADLNFATINSFMIKLGIGLILAWIFINFGLLKSILTHSFINLIALSSLLLSIHFVDEEYRTYTSNLAQVEYQKEAYFKSNKSKLYISSSRDTLEFTNMDVQHLKRMIEIQLNQEIDDTWLTNKNPFQKYTFKIYFFPNELNRNEKLTEILKILENKIE
ncbi:MAG: CPBP family intramembrane metalloprotease [Flavobacteriaceae bacterium]|nr:CPBP family intramembrane metalloprotease [Flavobacteriaceae bacterium]